MAILNYLIPCAHAVPTITVSIKSSTATPVVGSVYSLICSDTGTERLPDATVTYQWFKNGAVVSGQIMATLSFSPLAISDAGNYTCQATITFSLLRDPITTASSNSVSVAIYFAEEPATSNPAATVAGAVVGVLLALALMVAASALVVVFGMGRLAVESLRDSSNIDCYLKDEEVG